MSGRRMRWWGWGLPSHRLPLRSKPGLISYLRSKFGISSLAPTSTFQLNQVELTDSTIPEDLVAKYAKIVGEESCTRDKAERVTHACGKSYKDLLRVRNLKIDFAPDLVVYPKSGAEVAAILKLSATSKVAVVPFGGGTSVVGGVDCLKGDQRYCCSLDLSRLDKVLRVDPVTQLAEVEAGIFGPELEQCLGEQGYTLGHFPQSFEFSTLGGWIVTRSSGQNSILYGGIEKLLYSVTMVTEEGEIRTLDVPRMAVGPDFNQIICGSEGLFGVVTSAIMKITPLPAQKRYVMYFFPSFEASSHACREVVQHRVKVAMLRVSDEAETEGMLAMGQTDRPFPATLVKAAGKRYLRLKGIDLSAFSSVIVGLEGGQEDNKKGLSQINRIFRRYGGVCLGRKAGDRWLKERFALPYLRDELMDNGLLIDTLETVTGWDKLMPLYQSVRSAIFGALDGDAPVVYAHLSHLYPEGASIYFTILARQDTADPLGQWKRMKDAANSAIQRAGAAISHHHGVGSDHMGSIHFGQQERDALRDIKRRFDPQGVLNPGKLL